MMNQIKSRFLSEVEEKKFKNNGGIDVVFLEPSLEVSKLHLAKWVIGWSYGYVFKTRWNEIVRNDVDSLEPMELVQIWWFRMGPESQLGFSMIMVRDGKMVT